MPSHWNTFGVDYGKLAQEREGLVEFLLELWAMETRINKFLSEVGFCSRRAADRAPRSGVRSRSTARFLSSARR